MKVIEGSQCLDLSQSFLDIEHIIYGRMIMSTVGGSILGQLITNPNRQHRHTLRETHQIQWVLHPSEWIELIDH